MPPSLLVAPLRIEGDPYDVASAWSIPGCCYHASLPSGRPHDTSAWMFESLILEERSPME